MDDNGNPNHRDINARGYLTSDYRNEDQLLRVNDSSFLNFNGITLHTGTFELWKSTDIDFNECSFLYSGHNTHMLGADALYDIGSNYENNHNSRGNFVGDVANMSVNISYRNSEFAYSYNTLLNHGKHGQDYLIENCYFHNKPTGGGAVWTAGVARGNVVRRLTAHTIGFGGIGKFGNGNNLKKDQEGLVELAHIYDYHFHGDDAGIQVNRGSVAGLVLRNNWIHDLPGRNGIRFDGDPAGMRGTVNNNVMFNVKPVSYTHLTLPTICSL